MAIYEHLTHFAGLPVEDWTPTRTAVWPEGTLARLRIAYSYGSNRSDDGERSWAELLDLFLRDPASRRAPGIVVGTWGAEWDEAVDDVVAALVARAAELAQLRVLFLGDIVSEECEISWIVQGDVSPLFDAFPNLEHLGIRGGEQLALGSPTHERLRSLIIQTGGLPASVVHELTRATLPALHHLELWLGVEDYGGTVTVEDLQPLLARGRFPALRYLGLRDSEIADQIAAAVAQAPILDQLDVLDLSMGTLGDEGARALLASPAIRRLQKLDIHHHYCSPATVAALLQLGISLDASEPQEEEESFGERWRYVAVSE